FDTGGSQTTYYNLNWSPADQPVETGSDSVKFQIATATATTSTFAYSGPDGTATTYYTLVDTNINSANNNKRYVRYKLFLTTADPAFTPSVSDVSLTFGSECLPYGQVFFNGLGAGTQTLEVTKNGYQPFTDTGVAILNDWQKIEVQLIP
ncbi:MAG: hypothetical protein AAB505_01045, partial [Patescibacteria group bacterium]